jgi:hypothetical protein
MPSKRRGFSFVLVSGLLFLCLACLEIPEMSTLTDDVSNDFTFLNHGSSAREVVACAKKAHTTLAHQLRITQRREPALETVAEATTHLESRDLLALHSLRRT